MTLRSTTAAVLLCALSATAGHSYAQVKKLIKKAATETLIDRSVDRANNATNNNSGDNSSTDGNNSYPGTTTTTGNYQKQKRAGQIVFAANIDDLKKDAENEAGLSTKFTLGTPIYFRAYYNVPLTPSIQALTPDLSPYIITVHARFKVKFTIDNNPSFTGLMQQESMQNEWKDNWTTFKGALQASDAENYLGQDIFKNFITEQEDKLTNGTHTVKMELIPYIDYPDVHEGKPVATGTFTLTINANSIDPNNERLCLPAAQMHDKELEAGILKAFKAKGWKEQPQEVRIISTKWNIQRNERTGVVTMRTLDAVVASTRDGKCIAQEFSFAQDHDGTQFQKEIYLLGVGGQRDINCKCISAKK